MMRSDETVTFRGIPVRARADELLADAMIMRGALGSEVRVRNLENPALAHARQQAERCAIAMEIARMNALDDSAAPPARLPELPQSVVTLRFSTDQQFKMQFGVPDPPLPNKDWKSPEEIERRLEEFSQTLYQSNSADNAPLPNEFADVRISAEQSQTLLTRVAELERLVAVRDNQIAILMDGWVRWASEPSPEPVPPDPRSSALANAMRGSNVPDVCGQFPGARP